MKKFNILVFVIGLLLFVPSAFAHCPLCTTGAVIGVGVARYYGVDDGIVGIFLGALIVSSALWFNRWLKKRVNYRFQETALVLSSFLLFAVPFYYGGLITDFEIVRMMPEDLAILGLGFLGIDKLLAGMLIGSLAIWGVFALSNHIKNKRGSVLWPYQGLSFMFIALVILTIIFLVIT